MSTPTTTPSPSPPSSPSPTTPVTNEHDVRRVANVRPPDWRNPVPVGRYNLVVIGAGSAGLVTSLVAAGVGRARGVGGAALDGRRLPECGLRAVEGAAAFGARRARAMEHRVVDDRSAAPDFARAFERMREIRARISAEDAAARYRRRVRRGCVFRRRAFCERCASGSTHRRHARAT